MAASTDVILGKREPFIDMEGNDDLITLEATAADGELKKWQFYITRDETPAELYWAQDLDTIVQLSAIGAKTVVNTVTISDETGGDYAGAGPENAPAGPTTGDLHIEVYDDVIAFFVAAAGAWPVVANVTFDHFVLQGAYADDAAAAGGGLVAGQYYQTTGAGAAPLNAAGIVMVKQ